MMDVTTAWFYLYLGNVSTLIRSRVRYDVTAQSVPVWTVSSRGIGSREVRTLRV